MSYVPTRDQVAFEDTWDLTGLFPDDAAWEHAVLTIPAIVDEAASFEGRLCEGVCVVAEALAAVNLLHEKLLQVVAYASLRRDEDTTNTEANARYQRAYSLAIDAGQALAFVQPELLSLPSEAFIELAGSEQLATYRHIFDDLDRQRAHVRSQEVEKVLVQMGDVSRTALEAFLALDNADLDFGVVTDDQGNEVALTKGRYALLQESRDRNLRRTAYETLYAAYQGYGNTISSLFSGSVRKDVALARIHGFESARSEALFEDNVPDTVYDTLIEVVREATPFHQRYLDLRMRALGIDQLEIYDLRVPLVPELTKHYDYRDAVETVLSGARALGDEYVSDLRSGFESRWVDVHETKGKRSGAYSSGVYGAPPMILMNWNGTLSDVFTLAHESGHAMHSFYANRTQPFHLARPPIFLAEIASTVNEVLLTWDLLGREEAQDPLERFALLNRFADMFNGSVIIQTMYAEFEQQIHTAGERGAPLTLDVMNDLFGKLQETYLPGVNINELARIRWARIPHFYRAFYVYQYATGMLSAISIARAVSDEGEPAQKRYLEMLAAGGSDYPMNILKRVDVDLSDHRTLEVAMSEFEATLTEMETLVADGVLRQAAAQAAHQEQAGWNDQH